jgi:hypothetical protein
MPDLTRRNESVAQQRASALDVTEHQPSRAASIASAADGNA